MGKKSAVFLINPISGGIPKQHIPQIIEKYIDKHKFTYEVQFSESASDMAIRARQIAQSGVDVLIGVGGDGTINQVAASVKHTPTVMGMIPLGSGNGLARHLHIPLKTTQALAVINDFHTIHIDSGMANQHFFVNVAGAGFDAHVSEKFAQAPKRGFLSYAQITLKEFANYKAEEFQLQIDGQEVSHKAFLLCVGNGNQYGNNAYITPKALASDGMLDVSVLKPFPILDMPKIALDMFTQRFDRSKYVETYTGKSFSLKRQHAGVFNIDGEPVMMDKDVSIEIFPQSIQVIVPKQV